MQIAIAGSGAMGCRFGVMFYENGHDVLLLDHWIEHIKTINEKGLEILTEAGSRFVKIPAALPSNCRVVVDLLLISTKAMQTAEMISACQHLISDHTLVLTLQNGLGNIEILEQYVNRKRLFAGVTIFGTELLSAGKIQALGTGNVELMSIDGQISSAMMRLVDSMNAAGMNVVISKDVIKTIWSKVGFNSVLNTLCTLMECSVGQVGSYNQLQVIIEGIINEIVAVGQAEGITLEYARIVEMVDKVLDPKLSGKHYPSMYQDMENGRQTEIDYLNGAIVKYGEKHGMEVPYNRLITHLIKMKEQMRQYKQPLKGEIIT